MVTTYLAAFGGALLLALLLTPVVRRAALALGAVDHPGARKLHQRPVPRLGGAAVLGAVTLTVAAALWLNTGLHPAVAGGLGAVRWSVLAIAALLVVGLGAVDDLSGLSPRFKFIFEIAAATAVVVVAGAPRAIDFSPFAGPLQLGFVGPVLGVLWIVAITNAVNMSDGVDGVAAGICAITAVPLALASFSLGNTIAATVLFALSGALLGFLPHNFRTPKTFLGDSGSLGIGFILGSASLVGLDHGGAWLAVPALLILALPLTEVGLTVLRRIVLALKVVRSDLPRERFVLHSKRPGLFVADQRHIPHRLLALGIGSGGALAVLYVVTATLGVLGYLTLRWSMLGPIAALIALAAIVYFMPRWLYEELRLLERGAFLPILDNSLIRNRWLHATYDAVVVALSYLVAEVLVRGTAVLQMDGALWLRAATVTGAAVCGFWLAGLYRVACRHAGIAEVLRASRSALLG
ncbi:MAG: undecaprenyl/decaprenyl-phosphate alpha-N-acetylglucosaminyl 1-phosphate transferase, partial [Gemmatimonadota bacterium]